MVDADRGGVRTIDAFLDPAAAQAGYALLRNDPIPSSLFYIALDVLAAPDAVARLADYLPEALAAFVIVYLRRLSAVLPAGGDGFEIWTTHAAATDRGQVYLHIDCDEQLRVDHGRLRTPIVGSVLYLGPERGLVGGETLFVTGPDGQAPPFRFHDWHTLAGHDGVRVVEHRPGRLALFGGHLAHGQGPVVAHPPDAPRIALLANLWDARIGRVPRGICALDPSAYRARAG